MKISISKDKDINIAPGITTGAPIVDTAAAAQGTHAAIYICVIFFYLLCFNIIMGNTSFVFLIQRK